MALYSADLRLIPFWSYALGPGEIPFECRKFQLSTSTQTTWRNLLSDAETSHTALIKLIVGSIID